MALLQTFECMEVNNMNYICTKRVCKIVTSSNYRMLFHDLSETYKLYVKRDRQTATLLSNGAVRNVPATIREPLKQGAVLLALNTFFKMINKGVKVTTQRMKDSARLKPNEVLIKRF